jgi:hypothetical protein
MKERPIIMGAESVRAILEGRKTQTRRVVNPQPSVTYHWSGDAYEEGGMLKAILPAKPSIHFNYMPKCSYGSIGDRLWVRETAIISPKNFDDKRFCNSTDNEGDARIVQYLATSPCTDGAKFYGLKPKSPLFMPRWASRITLEITDIRVEMVQDITEEGAIAEGVEFGSCWEEQFGEGYCTGEGWMDYKNADYGCSTPKESYKTLWNSLNAKRGYSWEKNPWVWAITFKVVS